METYNTLTLNSLGIHLVIFALIFIPSQSNAGNLILNDTGINYCINNSQKVDCPAEGYLGQDGEYGRDAQARINILKKTGTGKSGFDFSKLDSNGAELPESANEWLCIKDNHTGLVWEIKKNNNNELTFNHPDALSYAEQINKNGGLCGFKDWRIPKREELRSIIDYSITDPALDLNFFPNTVLGWYWAAEIDSNHNTNESCDAWALNTTSGSTVSGCMIIGFSAHVRLVRGNQFSADFLDNEDGTILDKTTGLVWKKCSEGQTWDSITNSCNGSSSVFTWPEALQWAQKINSDIDGDNLGYNDWRLPNIKEASSIFDLTHPERIDSNFFPNNSSHYYWTSTPYNAKSMWAASSKLGNGSAQSHEWRVRLVRNRKSFFSTTPRPATPINGDNHKVSSYGKIGNFLTSVACSPGPILASSGNFFHNHTDIRIPALGIPLGITRYYNNQDLYAGPFGRGWNIDQTAQLIRSIDDAGNEVATVRLGNGVRRKFLRAAGESDYLPPVGQDDTLFERADGTLVFNGECGAGCARKPRMAYRFRADGFLIGMEDINGNTHTIGYNGNGRLSTITDASGRSLSFAYGANGRVESITDFTGRAWNYVYDAEDRLTSVIDPDGNTIQYQYDTAHNLTAVIDARGNTDSTIDYDTASGRATSFTDNGGSYPLNYNPVNRVTEKTNPAAGLFRFEYDANGNITNKSGPHGTGLALNWDGNVDLIGKTDARNVETTYSYDSAHNVTGITRDAGGLQLTTQFDYDSQIAKINRITDPRGNITDLDYDASGNLLSRSRPIGTISYTYDAAGNVTRITDPDGVVVRLEYDANGYLVRRFIDGSSPLIETTYGYDARGNRTSETDANGNTTSYAYDVLDRLASVTDALGNTTDFVYDANGNLIRITNPRGVVTEFSYDEHDRLIARADAVVDPLQRITSYAYDSRGNLISVIDPNGNTTSYAYDQLSRLIEVTNALGDSWTFNYDVAGNRTGRTDPNGNITTYGYDALNRLVSVTDAEDHVTQYDYDGNGNLLTITDANGNTASDRSYDANDRLVASADALNHTTTLTYTDAGRLASRTDANGQTTDYSYDPVTGRLSSIDYPGGRTESLSYDPNGNLLSVSDSQTGLTVSYVYNVLNRVVSETQLGQTLDYGYDANGNRTGLQVTGIGSYSYGYDALDRLVSITNPDGELTEYDYDAGDRRTEVRYANGMSTAYTYDALDRLVSITHRRSDTSIAASYGYTYDKLNNRLSETDHNGDTVLYVYDATYKLVSAQYPSETLSFSYDGTGNRLSRTDAAGTTSYDYDAANRLTQQTRPDASTVDYSYDANGNIQTATDGADVTSYTYDIKDQLVRIDLPNGVSTQYRYDPLGRRARASDGGSVQRFLHDGRNPLADIAGDDAVPVIDATYTAARALDDLVSRNRGTGTEFYLRDGLNSVRQLADAGETVTDGYTYQPYGALRSRTGSSNNPFTYTGRRTVANTDLMYYRSRYYDPYLGRFLKKDRYEGELGDPSSLHRYVYAKNNPESNLDPSGRSAQGPIIWYKSSTKENEYQDTLKEIDDLMTDAKSYGFPIVEGEVLEDRCVVDLQELELQKTRHEEIRAFSEEISFAILKAILNIGSPVESAGCYQSLQGELICSSDQDGSP